MLNMHTTSDRNVLAGMSEFGERHLSRDLFDAIEKALKNIEYLVHALSLIRFLPTKIRLGLNAAVSKPRHEKRSRNNTFNPR